VVVSEAFAKEHGLDILARIDSYATGAVEPRELFFAPIRAVGNLLAKENSKITDFDLIEANEAFASQSIAGRRRVGLGSESASTSTERDRPWASHRRQWGARAGHAAVCPCRPGRASRPGHVVPGGGDAVAMSITRN
jgi:acetyl-CoA C-acetyltransferase